LQRATGVWSLAALVPLGLLGISCAARPLAHPGKESSGRLTLVSDGQAHATIVIATGASAKVRTAAERIRDTIRASTGVAIPIAEEKDGVAGPRLLVGMSAIVRSLGVEVPAGTGFHDEGIVIQRVGADLVIAGNDDGPFTNTQDAATRFLELALGADVYYGAPLGKVVPRHTTVAIGDLHVRERPVSAQRTFYNYLSASGTDWSAMDLFHQWHHWGGTAIEHRHCHADIAPPDVYFASHPEYYCEIRGKRSITEPEGWQLCTTNPDVIRLAVELCRRKFDADPGLQAASLSCNDGLGMCTCAECRKLDYPDPVSGGGRRMVVFANAVARELAKTHPGKYVAFYAYLHTLAPPTDMKCDPNVIVVLADNLNCMFHPYTDRQCGLARDARLRLDAWMKIAAEVLVYDYYGLYGGYIGLPFSNLHRIIASAQYLRSRGVHGITCDGVYTPGPEGLRVYTCLRSLWETDPTAEEVTRRFCDGLYGQASPAMQRYYRDLERACTEAGLHYLSGMPGPLGIWTDETFATLESDLAQARSLVAAGTPERARVDEQGDILAFGRVFVDLTRARLAYYDDESAAHKVAHDRLSEQYRSLYAGLAARGLVSFGDAILNDHAPRDIQPLRTLVTLRRTAIRPSADPLAHADAAWILYGTGLGTWGSLVDQDNFLSYPNTSAQMTYDEQALHVRVHCHDPDVGKIRARAGERDGDIWADDCVRLSLALPTGADRTRLHDFYVNAAGVRRTIVDGRRIEGAEWSAQVARSDRLDARLWAVSVRIPWTAVGLQAPPAKLRANLFRHVTTTRRMPVHYWAPTFGPLDRTEKYAEVVLAP